jgi:K+-sensing histidine kinase KdpD
MSAAFGIDCRAGDSPKGVRRYAVAGLPVLVGIAIQVALAPHPNLTIPLLISLLVVIVTANLAGRAPALLATAASFLVDWYFFAQPRLSFALPDAPDVWRLAAFAAAGTAISLLSHRLSGTRRLPRLALLLASSLFLVIVAALVWFDFTNSRAAESSVEHTYQVLNASQLLFSTIEDVIANWRRQNPPPCNSSAILLKTTPRSRRAWRICNAW